MRMDINYRWADWSENYEVYAYYHQHYTYGMWYDSTVMSYDEAIEEIKKVIRQKAIKDHPHLNLTEITKAPDIPVYKDVVKPLPVEEQQIRNTKSFEEQMEEFTGTLQEFEQMFGYLKTFPRYKAAYEQQENKLKQTI